MTDENQTYEERAIKWMQEDPTPTEIEATILTMSQKLQLSSDPAVSDDIRRALAAIKGLDPDAESEQEPEHATATLEMDTAPLGSSSHTGEDLTDAEKQERLNDLRAHLKNPAAVPAPVMQPIGTSTEPRDISTHGFAPLGKPSEKASIYAPGHLFLPPRKLQHFGIEPERTFVVIACKDSGSVAIKMGSDPKCGRTRNIATNNIAWITSALKEAGFPQLTDTIEVTLTKQTLDGFDGEFLVFSRNP